jgi:hypothetical protein
MSGGHGSDASERTCPSLKSLRTDATAPEMPLVCRLPAGTMPVDERMMAVVESMEGGRA